MSFRNKKYSVFLALLGVVALLSLACTTADSGSEESTEQPTVTEVVEPTSGTQLEPEPTATVRPRTTVTPTPTPEETQVSETESVSFYVGGFNSLNRGEYIEAERTFTTVIELEPEFARGWDGRGQSLMLQGKYEQAMLDFDRAIELKPNLSEAYANRGLTRLAINDFDGASRDARRAYELDEESVAAQLTLGRVYANQGEATAAREWFDLAIETDPEDASTWWWRGRFFRDVLAQGNPALSDFNKAIELAPAQAAIYLDRALLYIQAQVNPDQARTDLEEAISLSQDPRLPAIIERSEELLKILDERTWAIQ